MNGSILVIRGGAIGDFVLTLPVLTALRAQFPQTRLGLLGYAHIAGLARAGGLVDDIRSIEAGPMAAFFARNGDLSSELAGYFESFSIIVSYLYDPDEIFRANIARVSRAQFIQGPHRPEDAAGHPASQVFLKPLERLAIFDADPVPHLQLARSVDPHLGAGVRLALHPGSGSERKNWPEASWVELLSRLAHETNWPLLLVGGEAEGNRLERLARIVPSARLELAQNLALPELGAKLESCRAFMGHDSGISHLAAAVGLPGVVLWGQSVEAVWRPPSSRVVVLRQAEGLESLSVDRVFAVLLELEAMRQSD